MKALVQEHHQAEILNPKAAPPPLPVTTGQLKKSSAAPAEASAKVRISLSAATLASVTEHKATGNVKNAVVFPRSTPSKDLLKKVKSKVRATMPQPLPPSFDPLQTKLTSHLCRSLI